MHTAVFIKDEYSGMCNSVALKVGFSLGLYFSHSHQWYKYKPGELRPVEVLSHGAANICTHHFGNTHGALSRKQFNAPMLFTKNFATLTYLLDKCIANL